MSTKYEPMPLISTSPLLANAFNDETLIDLIELSDVMPNYDDTFDYCYDMVLLYSGAEKKINRTINVLSNLQPLMY